MSAPCYSFRMGKNRGAKEKKTRVNEMVKYQTPDQTTSIEKNERALNLDRDVAGKI